MASKIYESGISGFEDALEMFCELPEGQLALVAAKLGGPEGVEAMKLAIRVGNGLEDVAVLAAMFGDVLIADFVAGHKDFCVDKPGELFELMPLAAAVTCGNVDCALRLLAAGADMFAPANQDIYGQKGSRPAILGANEQVGSSNREIMAIAAVLEAYPEPMGPERADLLMNACVLPILKWCGGWTESKDCRAAGLQILDRLIRDGADSSGAYQMALKAVCQDSTSSSLEKPGVEFFRRAKAWGGLDRAQCSGILGRLVYGVGSGSAGAAVVDVAESYREQILGLDAPADENEAAEAFVAMLRGAYSGLAESGRFGFDKFDSGVVAGNMRLFCVPGFGEVEKRCVLEALSEPGVMEALVASAADKRMSGSMCLPPASLDELIAFSEEHVKQNVCFSKGWQEAHYVAGLMALLKGMELAPELSEKVCNLDRSVAVAAFAKSLGLADREAELAMGVEAALLDLAVGAAPKAGAGALRV